jgi:MFS family permease
VLRDRDFARFFAGYATSLLGTSMSALAVSFAVLDGGGTASDLGVVLAAGIVPQVLFMLGGGVLADRIGRRPVMLGADAARCAAQAALAGAVLAGHPALWVFILLAMARGTGDAVFTPALSGLTVELAPPDDLVNANALLSAARSTAVVAGPSLAGVLVALAGPGTVIAIDAGSYAVSVLALASLRLPAARQGRVQRSAGRAAAGRVAAGPGAVQRPAAAGSAAPGRAAPGGAAPGGAAIGPGAARPAAVQRRAARRAVVRSGLEDLREGWAEFRGRAWLVITTVQFTLFNLLTWGPFLLLGPVLCRDYLGGAGAWGAVMACYGAGSVLGSLLALGRRPHRPMAAATAATFGYGLPCALLALHAPVAGVAAGALAAGTGSALAGTFSAAAEQQQLPAGVLARVTAFQGVTAFAFGPLAFAAAGPVAAVLGARTVLGFGAVWSTLSCAVVLALPAVRAVTVPPPARTGGAAEETPSRSH